jgi:hypothetical protein
MIGPFALLRELRRRHVFRGAGFYIVEPAGLPAWTMTALLYLDVAGFSGRPAGCRCLTHGTYLSDH